MAQSEKLYMASLAKCKIHYESAAPNNCV